MLDSGPRDISPFAIDGEIFPLGTYWGSVNRHHDPLYAMAQVLPEFGIDSKIVRITKKMSAQQHFAPSVLLATMRHIDMGFELNGNPYGIFTHPKGLSILDAAANDPHIVILRGRKIPREDPASRMKRALGFDDWDEEIQARAAFTIADLAQQDLRAGIDTSSSRRELLARAENEGSIITDDPEIHAFLVQRENLTWAREAGLRRLSEKDYQTIARQTIRNIVDQNHRSQ